MNRKRASVTLGAGASVGLLALLSPLILGVEVVRRGSAAALRTAFQRRWGKKGRLGILVYSDSPNWKEHIQRTVEVLAFRHWRGERDFNPMAILFLPRKPVIALRFRPAFKELKHGNPEPLRALEGALLRDLGAA
jgi:hypothetical protein